MLKTDDAVFKGMQKCLADKTFTIVFLTDAFMELLGYSREELSLHFNNQFYRLVDDQVREYMQNELALGANQGGQCNMHFKMSDKYGKDIHLLFGGSLLDEAGETAYYFSVIDVTQYYKMDSFYKTLLENLPIPVFVSNGAQSLPFINQQGRSRFLNKDKDCVELLCREFGISDSASVSLEEQEPGAAHFVHLDKSVYQVFANAMPPEEGELSTYCLAALDVSDIFTINETTRALLENTSIGVMKMRCDSSQQLLYANEEYYELLGYSKAAWFSRRKAILHGHCEDGFGDLIAEINLALACGQDKIEYEFLTTQQNGNQVWLLMRGRFDYSEDIPILNGIFMDITDRKETERELRQAQEWYRIALGHRSIAVWEYDPNKRQLRHNDSFSQVHGMPSLIENMPEALLDMGFVHPDYAAPYLEIHHAIQNGQKTASCTLRGRYENGTYRWMKISYIAQQDELGNCVRAVGVSEDISHLKNLQISSLIRGEHKENLIKNSLYSFEADISDNRLLAAQTSYLSKADPDRFPHSFDDMLAFLRHQYVLPADRPIIDATFSRHALLEAAESGEAEVFCEYRILDGNDDALWMRTVGILSQDQENQHVLIFTYTIDIDRQKRRQLAMLSKTHYPAQSFMLTKALVKRTVQATLKDAPADRKSALYVISPDNLQRIYDCFGRAYGDGVLAELSTKLDHLFNDTGFSGEASSQNFVFFLPDVADEADVLEKADRIQSVLSQTYRLESQEIALDTFVGIAIAPDHGKTFDELLSQGEKALYLARSSSDSRIAVYHECLQEPDFIPLPKDLQMDVSYIGHSCQSMPELIFRLLSGAGDFPQAVSSALGYIGRHFSAHCAYILLLDSDERLYTAYQWQHPEHRRDVPLYPVPVNMQKSYLQTFSGCGFYQVPNLQQAPKIIRDNLTDSAVSSTMEGAFSLSGQIRGIVCLHTYGEPRIFSDEQKSQFKVICDVVGTCICAHTLQERWDNARTLAMRSLDMEPNSVVVIDPETHRVIYANEAAKQHYPLLTASTAGSCHKCLYNQDEPCASCPVAASPMEGVRFETYIPHENRWLLVTATPVPWSDGKTYFLVRNTPLDMSES